MGQAGARLRRSPRLTRATPLTGEDGVTMRAGSARLSRAAGTGERKSGPEWPGLCWKGCGRQRQLFGRPEGGTMGDDMDAIVPEREMKVEIGWGLTACGSPGVALERPPPPPASNSSPGSALSPHSVRSSVRVASVSSLQVRVTCPQVGLATPLKLPLLLSCAGRHRSNNDFLFVACERCCGLRHHSPYN